MDLPEFLWFLLHEFVVWVLGLSSSKWWGACLHDEENDGSSKQIHGCALIRPLLMDLRGHVALSAKNRVQLHVIIIPRDAVSESEVSDFELELTVV